MIILSKDRWMRDNQWFLSLFSEFTTFGGSVAYHTHDPKVYWTIRYFPTFVLLVRVDLLEATNA